MAAPEPLSPAGGAGEEGPEEDEDEAEAEDPERPVGAIGARSGSSGSGGGGGGGGAGAGGSGGPGGALTRRAVTLRVLLKDAQLEPGAGVLSIYYLSPASEGEEEELLIEEEEEEVLAGVSADDKSRRLPAKGPTEPVNPVPGWRGIDAAHFPYLHPAETTSPGKRVENKIRVPVRYCMLGSRDSARNPHTLVEVTSFAAINKFQPFNVAISSNVLFLLDFHSHLTRSEVVGYLGGRWDINSQMLTVLRAFPCRSRLGDVDTAATMEEEPHLCPQIYQSLLLRGLSLVGWYHSHPHSPALPSLQDIDTQMDYQLRLQGSSNGFQPCLALLCSPYYSGNLGPESKISPFWVMPPPEQRPSDYGIPMDVEMAYVQDSFLTNDIFHEMMLLVEFYKGAPDLVRFQEPWNQEHTYLDKLKISLASRMPKDQGLCHVLEQVYSVLKQGN
ncbi:MPN domain-containing protein isoform X8 [Saccopteryx leptura]|uniref:MPN domain-containing protein isoform X8 n=1 Tax=Saccopteryx leptura TaxID=249018 RepID=UPI00339C2CE2